MIIIKNKIILKLLDNEMLLSKNKKIYKIRTEQYIKNNYIFNYKILLNTLKKVITEYKLSNIFIQNKLLILINKLYCETNYLVLKIIMNELGFSNYKLIYEEDLYKNMYPSILSLWNDKGIYLNNDVEKYIDMNNKTAVRMVTADTLLITNNKNVISKLNKDIIIYEDIDYPIFKLLE